MAFQKGTWTQLPSNCTRSYTLRLTRRAEYGTAVVTECVPWIQNVTQQCLQWAWRTASQCLSWAARIVGSAPFELDSVSVDVPVQIDSKRDTCQNSVLEPGQECTADYARLRRDNRMYTIQMLTIRRFDTQRCPARQHATHILCGTLSSYGHQDVTRVQASLAVTLILRSMKKPAAL
jgi:hypothetical protein